MQLVDGLNDYKSGTFYTQACELEKKARNIISLINNHPEQPTAQDLQDVEDFLVEIEQWKASCLQDRTGLAVQNSSIAIWTALRAAITADNDLQALEAIMQLKGFGASIDGQTRLRRAKLATAVLRFLAPEQWGVVDWRTAAILGFLEREKWDIEQTIQVAKKYPAKLYRDLFQIIDEKSAIVYNNKYRHIQKQYPESLFRAADVDMALFGLSQRAWPMK